MNKGDPISKWSEQGTEAGSKVIHAWKVENYHIVANTAGNTNVIYYSSCYFITEFKSKKENEADCVF